MPSYTSIPLNWTVSSSYIRNLLNRESLLSKVNRTLASHLAYYDLMFDIFINLWVNI